MGHGSAGQATADEGGDLHEGQGWSQEEAFETCHGPAWEGRSPHPWFACLDLTYEFGWFLLVMLILLLLSAMLERTFERLDAVEGFGGELCARVKSELTILGTLSFCMFVAVGSVFIEGYKKELVETVHYTVFIAAVFYCLVVMSFLVIRSHLRRMHRSYDAWLRAATPAQLQELEAVSYTHLTLPTILLV